MADNWYYAKDGERLGPFSSGDIERMIVLGNLAPVTNVWREGMENWKKASETELAPLFSKAPDSGEFSNCSLCKRSFAVVDLVDVVGHVVCADCKPLMLRSLQEVVPDVQSFRFAGFWARFCALFADWCILALGARLLRLMLKPLILYVLEHEYTYGMLLVVLYFFSVLLLELAYFVYFYHKKGATLGKMALGIKIVNADGSDGISYGKAVGRCFAEILSGALLLIGFFMMLFDERGRTLHDRLCGTLVVYKK